MSKTAQVVYDYESDVLYIVAKKAMEEEKKEHGLKAKKGVKSGKKGK